MGTADSGAINLLDKIRYGDGIEKLVDFFARLIKKDLKRAVDLINQESLSFTTLFLLNTMVREPDIFERLSPKNKIALEFIDEKLVGEKTADNFNLSSQYVQKVYSVLKWMLESGAPDDGLSDRFDELLDISAAILTREYRDRSVLSVICDMIFIRNAKGFFIHDLVWAFFESRDVHSLELIGRKLLSNEPGDVELACSLLCFVPGMEYKEGIKCAEMYNVFSSWIEENNMFLYYTGESFQITRRPMTYIINQEAKYLCKMVSVDTGEALKALSEKECELADEFKKLHEDDKKLLASFSLAMHRRDIKLWDEWMCNPVNEQLRTARSGEAYND